MNCVHIFHTSNELCELCRLLTEFPMGVWFSPTISFLFFVAYLIF